MICMMCRSLGAAMKPARVFFKVIGAFQVRSADVLGLEPNVERREQAAGDSEWFHGEQGDGGSKLADAGT